MCGATACAMNQALFTFRVMTRSNNSDENSASLARFTSDPALLTRMSTPVPVAFRLSTKA